MELLGGKGTFSCVASVLLRITIALLREKSTLFCLLHESMQSKGKHNGAQFLSCSKRREGMGCGWGAVLQAYVNALSPTPRKHTPIPWTG